MPIKGLTDRGLAFPEIGRIRKGDKNGKNGAPRDLTYFRVEFDARETEAAAIFLNKYGPEPRELNVLLPFNDIIQVWDPFMEAYTAGRMVAKADGEKYLYLVDVKTGNVTVKNGEPYRKFIEGEILGTWRNEKKGIDEPIICTPAGRLRVIIPELARAAYLTVLTGNWNDIGNLSDQLRAFHTATRGRLAGVPFVLRRRPHMVSTPRPGGTEFRQEKWLLSIEADPEWVKLLFSEFRRLALPGSPNQKLINPPEIPIEHGEQVSGEIVDDDEQDPPANPQPYDEAPAEESPLIDTETPKPEAPKPMPAAGEKVKPATIKTQLWHTMCDTIAAQFPKYQARGGGANFYHISMTAAKLGFAEVTDENIADLQAKIEAHAKEA